MARKERKTQPTQIFNEAYCLYSKALVAHASFKVSDPALGEDLVQDTFLKAWNYLLKGGQVDSMKAFLFHILNNLIVDQYRKRKTVSLDKLIEKGYEPSEDYSKQMFNMIDGKETFPTIMRLPEKYQKVINMRYKDDLSLKEMAAITKESKNAISVQVHRGLEKLKLMYGVGGILAVNLIFSVPGFIDSLVA